MCIRDRARLKSLERELLAQALLDKELGVIDDAALQKRYEAKRGELTQKQIHVAQIFIAVPKTATPDEVRAAQSKASSAYARLVSGEAFEAVARELSDDAPCHAAQPEHHDVPAQVAVEHHQISSPNST